MKSLTKPVLPFIFFVLISCFSFAQQEATPVEAQKLSDNLYQLIGGSGANGGFYIGDDAVLVIDAKMDKQSVDGTFTVIKNITDKPIKYLINTHADGDHVMGNQYFPSSVTIIAHENCREEFFHTGREGSPSTWENPELAPYIPTVTFQDNMKLHLGSKEVDIYYFGVGHTTGDSYIFFPEENVAFIGDQYFDTRAQLIHSYKGGNSFEYVKTMDKMLNTIKADKFCSGHSEIASLENIEKHVSQIREKQEKVKNLINSNKALDEILNEFENVEYALIEIIYNELSLQ